MKKISLIVNVETYLHKTPQKIKHDLNDMFTGLEDLFQEAIQTLQNSIIQDVFDLGRTRQVLWQHAYSTIHAMLQDEEMDVGAAFIDAATTGFRDLCVDLHDSVIPHINEDGLDISDVHVTVDEVDTYGLHNGDVGEEVTIYITCTWDEEDDQQHRLRDKRVPETITRSRRDNRRGNRDDNRPLNRSLIPQSRRNTVVNMDEEQLHEWAPRISRPFVQGVMVDIITLILKHAMVNPTNIVSRNSDKVRELVWQSLKTQIVILEEELDTMDHHSYNQDIIEIYYCYEDHLKFDTHALNQLVDKMADYVDELLFTAGDLRDYVWRNIGDFNNVIAFRNKGTVTFRLLAK